MDDRITDSWRCPHCGARGRTSDLWCSLCHAERSSASAAAPATPRPLATPRAPGPRAEGAAVPVQRRGPVDPGRPLVGGAVPDDLLAELAGSLAQAERRLPRWDRPGVAAAAWTGIGTVVLLVAMLVAGLLL